jgi:hypothetical protein
MILIILFLLVVLVSGYFFYLYKTNINRKICNLEIKQLEINKKVTGLKIDEKKWNLLKNTTYHNCINLIKKKTKEEKLKIFDKKLKKINKINQIKKDIN